MQSIVKVPAISAVHNAFFAQSLGIQKILAYNLLQEYLASRPIKYETHNFCLLGWKPNKPVSYMLDKLSQEYACFVSGCKQRIKDSKKENTRISKEKRLRIQLVDEI